MSSLIKQLTEATVLNKKTPEGATALNKKTPEGAQARKNRADYLRRTMSVWRSCRQQYPELYRKGGICSKRSDEIVDAMLDRS